MVHTIKGIGEKGRPRGKPFKKGERPINAKLEDGAREGVHKDDILDDPRHEISVGREDVESTDDIDENLLKSETLVDQIEFSDGSGNNIKLRYIKLSTRLFKMQVLLNDRVEIKPVTYSGSSMGNNYWQLLKGLMQRN